MSNKNSAYTVDPLSSSQTFPLFFSLLCHVILSSLSMKHFLKMWNLKFSILHHVAVVCQQQ